jgi:hypothetical protein
MPHDVSYVAVDGRPLTSESVRMMDYLQAACAFGLHGSCDLEIDRAISAAGSREIRQAAIESSISPLLAHMWFLAAIRISRGVLVQKLALWDLSFKRKRAIPPTPRQSSTPVLDALCPPARIRSVTGQRGGFHP